MVHPDVVGGHVLRRVAGGPGHGEVDVCRDALGKALGQTNFRPLPPRPFLSLAEPLLQRGEGEIEQHGEGELVGEEVVADVRARIVAGHDLVVWIDQPEIEVGLLAEIARDLQHVTVDRLEDEFHPTEQRIERGLISGEIRADEVFEHRGVTVFGTPEVGDLLEAALDPRALGFTVFRNQIRLDLRQREIHGSGGLHGEGNNE